MRTKEYILNILKEQGRVTSNDIIKITGLTRPTVAQHFRELISAKKISKIGSTKNAYYIPYSAKKDQKDEFKRHLTGYRSLLNLSEDKLFNELNLRMNFKKSLSHQGFEIINYAFTEMVNNAIDHSRSKQLYFDISQDNENIKFKISDSGIGVFNSIKDQFKLNDNYDAVEHLLKGKQTTAPKKHSGEGIFFTSKIADEFSLKSSELMLIIDNKNKDIALLENKRKLHGTEVFFTIKRRTRKKLKSLFDEFSNEKYEFDKTHVTIHISQRHGNYVSRSEAKRILLGLDQFKRITFDFNKVQGIGQSFADEIFRVFHYKYPKIKLETLHTTKSVLLMIQRAESKPYN